MHKTSTVLEGCVGDDDYLYQVVDIANVRQRLENYLRMHGLCMEIDSFVMVP